MAEDRIIRVTGKGMIKVKPDVTRITVTLDGVDIDYGKTLEMSTKDTEALKDIFEKHGFERSDIKTLSFNIDTKYESYQTKDKSWRERFVGFEYKHILKVEFDSDNERQGKVLYSLANAKGISPDFRLSFTVKDKEASKNELLGKAVTDAKAKAQVLTDAAGVKLGDIKSIDYSWGEIQFEYSPIGRNAFTTAMCVDGDDGSFDLDIEPDDIEVSDTVTVVWEIG